MKYIFKILLLLSIVYLDACQEVIEIDLNSSSPTVVVDGRILVGEMAVVSLSYTSDYFTSDESQLIENAELTLFTSNGESEVLSYVGDGKYVGDEIIGCPNTDYELKIEVDNEMYTGNSSILSDFDLVSTAFVESTFSHPRMQGEGDSIRYNLRFTFTDNAQQDNYYIVEVMQGGETLEYQYLLIDDQFYEKTGIISYLPMMYQFEKGDEIGLKISSVDRATFDYYNQLSDVIGGGGAPMSMMGTPYNPLSNMGEIVLGYFVASSVLDTLLVVK